LVSDILSQSSGIIFRSQNVPENEEPSLLFSQIHPFSGNGEWVLAISGIEDEINMMFRNCWGQIPSDPAPHPRRLDTSTSISRNPKFGKTCSPVSKTF
jgi:hypothetical protein